MMKYESLRDWKYRILEGFNIQTEIKPEIEIRTNFSRLTEDGVLYIEKGFCWDGASGAVDTDNIMEASCIHDAFCNMFQLKLITNDQRKQADKLLYELCLKNHMSEIRAKVIYEAVRKYVEAIY